MISTEIKNRVNAKLLECIQKAKARYNRDFEMPMVIYRQMGRKAGLALQRSNIIELNSDFFHNGNLEDMINETAPHEFAHIITYLVYGSNTFFNKRNKPHGYEWKSVMRCLGLNPERCHNYSLEGVKIKGGANHEYTCKCGKSFHLSNIIHKRIQAGQHRICKVCKSKIFLKNSIPVINIPNSPTKVFHINNDENRVFSNTDEIDVPRDL
jgi:predicted SprT family Zn-dependent metalloprotease